jgi:hypothetical protein
MGKPKRNLLNKRFGRLLVLEAAPPKPNSTRAQWLCVCDCGVKKAFSTDDLMNRKITSCYRDCELHLSWKQYIGQQIGSLTIIDVEKQWCQYQCVCGNTGKIQLCKILNGNNSSCGNCNAKYIGKKFGRLKIIEYIFPGSFKTQCECGKTRVDECYRILTGHIVSCGNCGLYCNGRKTSKPQQIICHNIDGIENFKTVEGYYIDVALPDINIGIEYDEWYWHKNRLDEDMNRINKLINSGWKILHIKAKQNIPSEQQILNGLQQLKNHQYYCIKLDGWGI